MERKTLEKLVGDPAHTHCVLEIDGDARSVRIAADRAVQRLAVGENEDPFLPVFAVRNAHYEE